MNINQLTRIVFRDKQSYKTIDDKTKSSMFFLFNRVMARKFASNASTLNINNIDTSLALDVWFDAVSPRFTDIPKEINVPWNKLKKDNSVLNGFSEIDKYLLSFYPELIEQVKEKTLK